MTAILRLKKVRVASAHLSDAQADCAILTAKLNMTNPKKVTMNWYCVRVPGKRNARSWIILTRTVYEDAGFPGDCSIHHAITPDGQNLLYFSPGCGVVFASLLKLFGAEACEKPSEVETLRQVLNWPHQPAPRNNASTSAAA